MNSIKNIIIFSFIYLIFMSLSNMAFCEVKEDFLKPKMWSELEIALIIADIRTSDGAELIYRHRIIVSKKGNQRIIVDVLLKTSSDEISEWIEKSLQYKRDYFKDMCDGYVAIVNDRILGFSQKDLDMFYYCLTKDNKMFFQGAFIFPKAIVIDKWIDLEDKSESPVNQAMKLVLKEIKLNSKKGERKDISAEDKN